MQSHWKGADCVEKLPELWALDPDFQSPCFGLWASWPLAAQPTWQGLQALRPPGPSLSWMEGGRERGG